MARATLGQRDERIGRRLKLRDLNIFMTVAQQGSMGRVAKQLAVSQPVVSEVISDLDRMLKVRLVDRTLKGAEPTVYGSALLRRGTIVFDELGHSVKEVEFLADFVTTDSTHLRWALISTRRVLSPFSTTRLQLSGRHSGLKAVAVHLRIPAGSVGTVALKNRAINPAAEVQLTGGFCSLGVGRTMSVPDPLQTFGRAPSCKGHIRNLSA